MVKSVVVFCGSSTGYHEAYSYEARRLGNLLAAYRITLVYGGGRIGLMGILADTVMKRGGQVVGIIPEFLNIKEIENYDVTELHKVKDLHERKKLMAQKADAAIVLPGGYGTWDEAFEFVTWSQLKCHDCVARAKPLGVLNVRGYYDNTFRQIQTGIDCGFIKREHADLVIPSDHSKKLLDSLNAWTPYQKSKLELI